MDLSSPIRSVIPSAHGPVLAVLARTEQSLTGRGVAELTRPRVGQSQTNEVLRALVREGVVLVERRPPSNLYRLNREHIAAQGVLALSEMWAILLSRLRTDLEAWVTRPDNAWMFGSAARGEGRSDSDIDILLIRPSGVRSDPSDESRWQSQKDVLTQKVRAWTGNACELLDLDRTELAAAVERGDRLVLDLRQDAVTLMGPEARTVLRRRAVG